MKPPAKVSPAPVGSKTVSSGYAGAKKNCPSERSSEPYSPRLITTVRGPMPVMARAALTRFGSPASIRASASLMSRTSTRSRTRRRSARLPSIQKFMVSSAVSAGRSI